MTDIVERLREEAGRDDLAYRTVTILMDAALEIERLRLRVNADQSARDFAASCR